MKRVLLYTLGGQGCQEAGQLDEALSQYNKGNKVLVVHCDQKINGCRDNFAFSNLYCKNCLYFQKRHANKYFKDTNIEYKSISDFYSEDIGRIVDEYSPEYSSVSELKDLIYKGVEVGYGLLSTYISATRNLDPAFTPSLRGYFDKVLKTEVLVTELLYRVVDSFEPDLIVFHNGRHWTYRPALGVAVSRQIPYVCTEFIHLPDGSEGKNYYFNTYPHDKYANAQKYFDFWDENKDSEEKFATGKSFFRNKVEAKYAGDTVYTSTQTTGLLPEGFDFSKRNIVIFNSSEDEMFSINREVDKDMLFPSQIDGIKTIVEFLSQDESVCLYLRIHPNLKNVKYSYHTDIYKIKSNNFVIIPADSPVSSYTLLDAAETVIVFGSTMGVEASYQGKKVINLACAFYDPLNIAYRPATIDELKNMLDVNYPPIQHNENAIKMGNFYMSYKHPQLEHVKLKTIRFKLLGRTMEAHSYRKLLGSSKLFYFYFTILSFISRKINSKFNYLKLQQSK